MMLIVGRAQQVEFPLGYYSFEEIAQRLSVDGRRVECARELRQQIALIRLQPRSWQQTRELLETGLDVRVRKTSDAENRWILERNPEVTRRERRWREKLADYIEKHRQRDIRLLQLMLDKNTPVEQVLEEMTTYWDEAANLGDLPEAQLRQARESIRQAIEMARRMPLGTALRNWRAYRRFQQHYMKAMETTLQSDQPGDVEAADYLAMMRQALASVPLQSMGFTAEELQWAERAAREEREIWKPIGEFLAGDVDPALLQASMLMMLGMHLQSYLSAWASDTLQKLLRPPATVLETLEQGVVAREYALMLPPELAAWLLDDAEGKQIPLDATAPVPVRLLVQSRWWQFGAGYSSEIQLLEPTPQQEQWALTTLPDYVMLNFSAKRVRRTFERIDRELLQAYETALERHKSLVQEAVVRAPLPEEGTGLFPKLYAWAKAQNQEIIAEAAGVFQQSLNTVQGKNLAELLENASEPCLLERNDTVWVLRRWTAFIHRVADYPFAAIRHLMQSEGDYAAWQRFYRETTPEQARWLLASGDFYATSLADKPTPVYLSGNELGAAWLVMAILESLPPAVRESLWKQIDTPTPIALSSLPPNAQLQLAQVLRVCRAALLQAALEERQAAHWLFSPEPEVAWVSQLQLARVDGTWMLYLPTPPAASPQAGKERAVLIAIEYPIAFADAAHQHSEEETPEPKEEEE
ncbi:MAG: hypothetical protein NZ874_07345 [Fimbriimonadales bacterium]|nr:hypothetical protein [Fimbriimonadales bacterium]